MASILHANARTTPRIRREIKITPSTVIHVARARKYGIHRHTVAKRRTTECARRQAHSKVNALDEVIGHAFASA